MDLDLLEHLGAKIYNKHYNEILGVCFNYSNAKSNFLFINIGNNMKHLHKSMKNGISALLTSKYMNIANNIMQIIHNDPMDLIVNYGLAMRQKYQFQLITICGTSGKSSFKHYLQQCLENVIFTKKSFNVLYSILSTFFFIKPHIKYVVLEVAQNYLNISSCIKYKKLLMFLKSAIIDILVVTNINYEHINNHETSENSIINNYKSVYSLINMSKKVVCTSNIYTGDKSINEYISFIDYSKNNQLISHILNYKYITENTSHTLERNFQLLCLVLYSLHIYTIPQKLQPLCFRGSSITLPNGNRIIDFSYNAIPLGIFQTLKYIKKPSIFIMGNIMELGHLNSIITEQLIATLRHHPYIKSVYIAGNMFANYIDNKRFFSIDINNLPQYSQIYIQGARSSQLQNYVFAYINQSLGYEYNENIVIA